MAHRPLYRVLGETSLELKCLSLFGAFFLLVSAANFLSYWYVTGQVVTKQNPVTGKLLADAHMLLTHWKGLQGLTPYGGKDTDEVNEERRREQDYLRTMVEKLRENAIKDADYQWKFISPDSKQNVTQPPDEYEREVLAKFLKHNPSLSAGKEKIKPSESVGGEQGVDWDEHPSPPAGLYRYYRAIRTEAHCAVFCHHDTPVLPGIEPAIPSLIGRAKPSGGNWAEGDLMAALRIDIPNEPVQKEVKWYWNALLAVAIITAFLAMIAFYLTIRYLIIRPLRHLREVSDSISRGNISQRANLRTGDEFESLSVAFNRMLLHLVTVQDELREVNSDLDGKVDELAQVNMQLYEMNRIKSDFLATMSHELARLEQHSRFQRRARIDRVVRRQTEAVRAEHSEVRQDAPGDDQQHSGHRQDRKREDGRPAFRVPDRAGDRRPVRHGQAALGKEEHRPPRRDRARSPADVSGPKPACSRSSITCCPTPSSSLPREAGCG